MKVKKNKYRYSKEEKRILKELRRFKRGYRLYMMVNLFNRGMILTILFLLLASIYKWGMKEAPLPGWIFSVPAFIFILFSLFKPIRKIDISRKMDKELDLKERMTTSLYFLGSKEPFVIPLFQDTLNRTLKVRPLSLFPVKWSRAALLISLLTTVLFLHYQVQSVESSGVSIISKSVKYAIQEEGARIKQLAGKMRNEHSILDPSKELLIRKLDDVGDFLQSETLDKREAFLALNDLVSKIKSQSFGKENDVPDTPERGFPAEESRSLLESEQELQPEDTLKKALHSIQLAKKHIAEADMWPEKKANRPGDDSIAGVLSQGKSNSGKGNGKGQLPLESKSSFSKSGAFQGEEIDFKKAGPPSFGKRSYPRGDLIRYANNVIPLDSLPKKYHRIISGYFDAISKEITEDK